MLELVSELGTLLKEYFVSHAWYVLYAKSGVPHSTCKIVGGLSCGSDTTLILGLPVFHSAGSCAGFGVGIAV